MDARGSQPAGASHWRRQHEAGALPEATWRDVPQIRIPEFLRKKMHSQGIVPDVIEFPLAIDV